MRLTCNYNKHNNRKSCGKKFAFVVENGLNNSQVTIYSSNKNIKKIHEPLAKKKNIEKKPT